MCESTEVIFRSYAVKSPPVRRFKSRWLRRLITLSWQPETKCLPGNETLDENNLRLVIRTYSNEKEERNNAFKNQFIVDDAIVEEITNHPQQTNGREYAVKISLTARYNHRELHVCAENVSDHRQWLKLLTESIKLNKNLSRVDSDYNIKNHVEKYQPNENTSFMRRLEEAKQEIRKDLHEETLRRSGNFELPLDDLNYSRIEPNLSKNSIEDGVFHKTNDVPLRKNDERVRHVSYDTNVLTREQKHVSVESGYLSCDEHRISDVIPEFDDAPLTHNDVFCNSTNDVIEKRGLQANMNENSLNCESTSIYENLPSNTNDKERLYENFGTILNAIKNETNKNKTKNESKG